VKTILRGLGTAHPTVRNAGGGLRILHYAFHPKTGRTGFVSPHSPGRQHPRPVSGDKCQDAHGGLLPLTPPYRLLH
jgi:hypothetical protein